MPEDRGGTGWKISMSGGSWGTTSVSVRVGHAFSAPRSRISLENTNLIPETRSTRVIVPGRRPSRTASRRLWRNSLAQASTDGPYSSQ